MKSFADNERYKLVADHSINRLYITIMGFWRTKDGYLEDLDAACKSMRPGFKIHVDLTTMQTPSAEIGEVHVDAQKILLNHGLAQTAEVLGDDVIARMALKKYADKSGMKKQVFSSHEQAKAWLDKN